MLKHTPLTVSSALYPNENGHQFCDIGIGFAETYLHALYALMYGVDVLRFIASKPSVIIRLQSTQSDIKGDRSSGCSAASNLKRNFLIGQSSSAQLQDVQKLAVNVSENMFRNFLRHK